MNGLPALAALRQSKMTTGLSCIPLGLVLSSQRKGTCRSGVWNYGRLGILASEGHESLYRKFPGEKNCGAAESLNVRLPESV